jgi:hypothetical protein
MKPSDSPYMERRLNKVGSGKAADGPGDRGQSYDALNGFLRN